MSRDVGTLHKSVAAQKQEIIHSIFLFSTESKYKIYVLFKNFVKGKEKIISTMALLIDVGIAIFYICLYTSLVNYYYYIKMEISSNNCPQIISIILH